MWHHCSESSLPPAAPLAAALAEARPLDDDPRLPSFVEDARVRFSAALHRSRTKESTESGWYRAIHVNVSRFPASILCSGVVDSYLLRLGNRRRVSSRCQNEQAEPVSIDEEILSSLIPKSAVPALNSWFLKEQNFREPPVSPARRTQIVFSRPRFVTNNTPINLSGSSVLLMFSRTGRFSLVNKHNETALRTDLFARCQLPACKNLLLKALTKGVRRFLSQSPSFCYHAPEEFTATVLPSHE